MRIAQEPYVDAKEAAEYLTRPASPGDGWEPGPERDKPASEETSVVYAMAALKAAGANVLVGCTYEPTTRAIVEALERVDFSPRATIASSSLGLDTYNMRVNEGWWQGEYVAGPTPWHASVPRTGAYSKLSSAQFAQIYHERTGDDVGYQGAAAFGAAAALASAIEAAGTLDTEPVRKALQTTNLHEFYANIVFDDNGQINAPMLVVQMQPRKQHEDVVYDDNGKQLARFVYPMPSWAQRRCGALGPGRSADNSLAAATSSDFIALTDRPRSALAACSGHGRCAADGSCACNDTYAGLRCQFDKDELGFRAPPVSHHELNPPRALRPRVASLCRPATIPPCRPAAYRPAIATCERSVACGLRRRQCQRRTSRRATRSRAALSARRCCAAPG